MEKTHWGSRIEMLEHELQQCKSDAALVIHALDCAMQLISALIVNLPDGSPLDPGVATAKHALDDAWAAIHGRKK